MNSDTHAYYLVSPNWSIESRKLICGYDEGLDRAINIAYNTHAFGLRGAVNITPSYVRAFAKLQKTNSDIVYIEALPWGSGN